MIRPFSTLLTLLALVCFSVQARAQAVSDATVGLSIPLQGRFAPVAKRVEFGALLAVQNLRGTTQEVTAKLVPSACEANAQSGKAAQEAASLLDQKSAIVIGNLCFRHAATLAKALNTANGSTPTVPVIALDTRNSGLDRLRRVQGLPLYTLSPAADAEARTVVEQILPQLNGAPWALVDDGSVYGRSLSDAIRLLAEEAGVKPTVVDSFRPLQSTQIGLMRRLRQSGVEAAFLAAGPEDIVTIMGNARTLSLNWTFAAGEQAILLPFTSGASTVPDGFLMAAPHLPKLNAAPELLEKLKGEEDRIEPALLSGYIAMQIAAQALAKADAVTGLPDLTQYTFDTLAGPLRFNQEGRATPIPFAVHRWERGRFLAPQQGQN